MKGFPHKNANPTGRIQSVVYNGARVRISHVLFALCSLVISSPTYAFPVIYQSWSDTYPDATLDDELIAVTGAPCQLCHVNPGGGEPWNQYGYSVLTNGGIFNIPQVFLDIENLDADGEGNTNLTEITNNSLPGWCDESTPGCQNLAWTRAGISSPATPPNGVTLDPPLLSPPMAQAGGPYLGNPGLRLRFNGSQSTDPDGQIVSYDWKFGDGFSGSGPQPIHVFAEEGTYIAHLKVTDNSGLTNVIEASVVIAPPQQPLAPVANAGGPYTGTQSVQLVFDGSGSFDPDGNIVSWNWDFGDGTVDSGEVVNHTFYNPGEYIVELNVIDGDGLAANDSTSASITEALGPGETIFRNVCQACHGDPWSGPAIDPTLIAGRRNTGARECSIQGAINGTLVFPGGVPQMQFLQGMFSNSDIAALSEFLNSGPPLTGQQRYVTTCAGCHGNDASGGAVNEDIRGRDAERIFDALAEEPAMAFLSCLPNSDVIAIGFYLQTLEDNP